MIRRALMIIVSLAGLAAPLAACSGGSSPPAIAASDVSAASVVKSQKGDKEVTAADYVIGAGDSLSMFVYRNPDLSEPGVAVRPDGRISIPLIEDITAAGKTPTQLARDIEDRLKKYIQDPMVTVIVRSLRRPGGPADQGHRRGDRPEAIPYRDSMTLLDVMIATKGADEIRRRKPGGNRSARC